jgi:hypothetical protein
MSFLLRNLFALNQKLFIIPNAQSVIYKAMSRYKSLLLLLLMLFPFGLQAQIRQDLRAEFEIKHEDQSFDTYGLGEQGLMLFRTIPGEELFSKNSKLEIIRLDTSLNQQWLRNYEIDASYELLGYSADQENLYLLFNDQGFKEEYFQLFLIDLRKGGLQKHRIFKTFNLELSHFEVIGGRILIGGEFKSRPVIMNYNPETQQNAILQGLYEEKNEILSLQLDTVNNVFNVILKIPDQEHRQIIAMRTYLSSGELLKTMTFPPEKNMHFLEAKSSSFQGTQQLLVGTYSHGSLKYPQGLFTLNMQAGSRKSEPVFYSFGELENFFNFMKPRRAERKKRRAERRLEKEKSLKLNDMFHLQNIFESQGKLYLVAEAYEPIFRRDDHLNYPGFFAGSNQQYNENNFKGYEISHAVVACFDRKGELLWDNVIKVNEILGEYLQGYVKVIPDQDQTSILYYYKEELFVKHIQGNKTVSPASAMPVKLQKDTDQFQTFYDNELTLKYWYGKNLYASGIQKIKSYDSSQPSRKVFFVNRLTHDFSETPLDSSLTTEE